ncbi:MAG: transglycosylase SLT domain-containing protein [Polyangiaceae bacterium]|nr:transglycosylase SLT domain-containing protein [Polyangiaceae bacterium]
MPFPAPSAGLAGEVTLEEYTPLLALPALAGVARALEESAPARATRELERVMGLSPPPGSEVARWQFLLGRLREQAGELTGAAASFDLASQEPWPLREYARVAAARVLTREGRHAAAIERIDGLAPTGPLVSDLRLVMGEAAAGVGDHGRAIAVWRAHLAAPAPADGANVALRLADALLALLATSTPAPSVAPPGSVSAAPPTTPAPVGSASAARNGAPPLQDPASEALALVRDVRGRHVGDRALVERAEALERRALAAFAPAERERRRHLTREQQLVAVEGLIGARLYSEAVERVLGLLKELPRGERWGRVGCSATVLHARALAGNKRAGEAANVLEDFVARCPGVGPDRLRPRALYLAGQYSARDGRHARAIQLYELLEKEAPTDRLADDARLLAARSYRALGSEARFTELLDRIAEDYPGGDMVLDGVFELALRRIEKGDWSGAASVLDRAASAIGDHDFARGTEFSGRERYFRARAWIETGERERGLAELATIVRDLPLSYYMLHAYSRLCALDRARATRARAAGIERSEQQPFRIDPQKGFSTREFARARELLRVGEIALASREIDALDVTRPGTAPEILWGVALLYARANAPKLSHEIARNLLTDWLARWPAGDWRRAWELAFPRPYAALVSGHAKKNDIPEYLVYAVMREESAFDPNAESPAGAYGLMQLIVPTAREYAKEVGLPWSPAALRVPVTNIALGSRVLGDLTDRFAANPLLAIPAYNAGPGRPRRWAADRPMADFDTWVELIPYRETRRYTKRVLASRAAYAVLYHPEIADQVVALPMGLGY